MLVSLFVVFDERREGEEPRTKRETANGETTRSEKAVGFQKRKKNERARERRERKEGQDSRHVPMTARKHGHSISRLVRTRYIRPIVSFLGQLENSLTTHRVVVSTVANGTFPWDLERIDSSRADSSVWGAKKKRRRSRRRRRRGGTRTAALC